MTTVIMIISNKYIFPQCPLLVFLIFFLLILNVFAGATATAPQSINQTSNSLSK